MRMKRHRQLSFIKTSYTCKINQLAMSSFGNIG